MDHATPAQDGPAFDVAAVQDAWTVEEVFRTYHPWIRTWIQRRLDRPDAHLADDLASETFLRLVRTYGDRAIEGRSIKGLLATVARRAISDHYQLLRSGETPIDTSDEFQARRITQVPAAEDTAVTRIEAYRLLADCPAATLAGALDRLDRILALVVAA